MNLLSILDGTPEPPIIDLHIENVNESGEYHLPTPMYEFQKELTDQIVSLHYPDILKYCETDDSKDIIRKSLEICIHNCMLVSTHPYLLIHHYMPKNLALKDMSSKLAETSGKFHVLKNLMNVIIHNNTSKSVKNIGVVMSNNAGFFDLAEALFLGCSGNKSIKRYVGNHVRKETAKSGKSNGSADNPVTNIHLIPHDANITKHEDLLYQTKFDVLIVFDGTVDVASSFFRELKSQNRRGEAIVIRAIPMRTIEHCKLYYESKKNDKDYLYKLISSIVCLRDQIGNLPPDLIPIYNQNLTYLSQTFFDAAFKHGLRGPRFPAWPLPELPPIPRFSEVDVERSLLTEVHFHYTPYDSYDNVIDYAPPTKKKGNILSYYESKRLESDYITNPLKNDFNKLSGIHSHTPVKSSNNRDSRPLLTHKLIVQLNGSYIDLESLSQECEIYENFNESDRQDKKIGRRETEYAKTLCNISNDVDHAEQRIQLAEKKSIKKLNEIEDAKVEIEELDQKINSFIKDNGLQSNEELKKYIENQIHIWEIKLKIKENLIKIKAKNEEKNYTNKEYTNALTSIKDSEQQITEAENNNEDLKRKISLAYEAGEEEERKFKIQKKNLMKKIENERESNLLLKKKLGKSLKFLRDTSHLKKRKGRGLTPIQK